MMQRLLFYDLNIFDAMRTQKERLRDAVHQLPPSRLDDPQLAEELAERYSLDVPILDENRKYGKKRPIDIDASRNPANRFFYGDGGPHYIKGQELTVYIPFTGDSSLFGVRPASFDTNPPRGEAIGQELALVYELTSGSNPAPEIERTINSVKKYLDWLRPSASQLKVELLMQAQELIAHRKREEAAHAEIFDSLGIPIRDDTSATPVAQFRQAKRQPDKGKATPREKNEWDVFISHASEDKEDIARPLADALTYKGTAVWYDEFSLKLGDSLRRSIDNGLSRSKFGVVILSKHFFEKHWPQQELNGLATREVNGKKVILPVWHRVGFDEVRDYSPTLADRLAARTEDGLEEVVKKILEVIE